MEDNKCDYKPGKFNPVSFDPRLNWRVEWVKRVDSAFTLPASIRLKARIAAGPGYQTFIVVSHPYSYGKFSLEIGGSHAWFDTVDPEDAVYLAEDLILKWAESELRKANEYYGRIIERLKKIGLQAASTTI